MRLAYFSPLNPLKSGVSDYSEELLPHLAEKVEVELFVDNFTPSNKAVAGMFPVFPIDSYAEREKNYDAALYHIGNDGQYHEKIYQCALKYPGIVVMHDFAIHHMIERMTLARDNRDAYLAEMAYSHGDEGKQRALAFLEEREPPPWDTEAMKYPLNRGIIEAARGIICHSYFTRNKIKQIRPAVPVKRVYHHCADIVSDPADCRREARRELGLPEKELVLASFGFVTPSKRIDRIIAVLARLYQEGYRFKYWVAGKPAPEVDIDQLLKIHRFPRDCINLTGYLELGEFNRHMKATDICFNLRYPVMGETSGSLHRILGLGKAVIVSNIGSFREYPDDAVVKIDLSSTEERQLYEALKTLILNPQDRERLGLNAHLFARENLDPSGSAREYSEFIAGVYNGGCNYSGLVEALAETLVELSVEQNDKLVQSIAETVAGLSRQPMK